MKSRPKHIPALAELVATAWNNNTPEATFAGLTLAQFRTATQASSETRDKVLALATQSRARRDERDAADAVSRDAIQRVVGAVRSDPAHGPDSPLLSAMGYVTRSGRKSGKTNKPGEDASVAAVAK